ncbi:Undecaprenyl pyrophosphate synthetase family protein [Striga hermonthica]|uniref:ditrans,polycis-polyprenyl diphosphate synthase [(2E,6E)-farnesyldiphosphate specific] n=1 Tax=Striga hermonthica TaxID=68872 RepID=A0A9N7MMC9_STRHE|nr:Undecaprenyl pyrophosphate synthetase family protein [Striga hermonthica]
MQEGTSDPVLEQKYMSLEVISFSDSKDAVAKAANFLLKKRYLDTDETPELTEPDMTNALEALGYGTLEPDLMLIYGPARCHLGFPAWRSRYTEMV